MNANTLADLARFDLNLLVVFGALLETRHVGRAARSLGLSQPAVSHALARLRAALGDPLFVRVPRGIAPTRRAHELAPRVTALLHAVRDDVLAPRSFTPAEIERTFVIRATGLLEVLLLPALVRTLAEAAPRARVSIRQASPEFPAAELESGACDLAIAGFFTRVPPSFKRQVVLRDSYLCAVRVGHPRVRKRLTLPQYCAERHLLIAPGGELVGTVDHELAKRGRSRMVAVGLSEFLSFGFVLSDSDCVFTGPRCLLERAARHFPLQLHEPPLPMGPITIAQVWHERHSSDPAHAWFRAQVAELMRR
jgi:DNA-binding transcriptional LysR family regulator